MPSTILADSVNVTVGLNGNLDKIAGSVNKVFDVIANKIGSSSDQIWQLMVYQQKLNAYRWLGLYVILLCLTILFILVSYKVDKKGDGSGYLVSSAVTFAILVIIMLVTGATVFTGLFNPEYGALKNIMSLLNNQKDVFPLFR